MGIPTLTKSTSRKSLKVRQSKKVVNKKQQDDNSRLSRMATVVSSEPEGEPGVSSPKGPTMGKAKSRASQVAKTSSQRSTAKKSMISAKDSAQSSDSAFSARKSQASTKRSLVVSKDSAQSSDSGFSARKSLTGTRPKRSMVVSKDSAKSADSGFEADKSQAGDSEDDTHEKRTMGKARTGRIFTKS